MGRKQNKTAAADGQQSQEPLPKGAVLDARTGAVFVPIDSTSSEDAEAAVQSTDTVADVLAGNYSESIVDEVRRWRKRDTDAGRGCGLVWALHPACR